MLPLAPGRRLLGRRHEYYLDSDGNPLPSIRVRQIVIHHWGFTEENVNRKETVEQNAKLTLRQLEETPIIQSSGSTPSEAIGTTLKAPSSLLI